MKYLIKEGKQWARWWFLRWPFFYGDTMERNVRFDESCIYDRSISQWNKLFGFSVGLNPIKNNFRIVFRPDVTGWLQITHFTHKNSQHDGAEQDDHNIWLAKIDPEYSYKLIIRKENVNGKCLMHFNDLKIQTDIPYSKFGWKLYPYFGGKIPAPHDIHISLTNPNTIMRQLLDSIYNHFKDLPALIKKHWFMSLVFLLIAPLVIIWSVYSERDQWAATNYLFVLAPILVHLFILLPLLNWAVKEHK